MLAAMMRSKMGPALFGIYLLLYGSFVTLAAFSPAAMDAPIAGINAAVWWGFVLIVAAIVLAVLYVLLAPVADEGTLAASPPAIVANDVAASRPGAGETTSNESTTSESASSAEGQR